MDPATPLPADYAKVEPRQTLVAILVAALCAALFLRESLLPGRALVPFPPELFALHAAEAKAEQRFDPRDALRGNLFMGDKYAQSLCWDRVLHERLTQGELPLWTNDIAGGASFVPQMAQVYQPWNLLLLLLPPAEWYGWVVFLHLAAIGWCAWRFLRELGCMQQSALFGLVVAELGLWSQARVHHNVIYTAALPLFPLLILVLRMFRDGATWRRTAAVGLWSGLSWLSGFAVISLHVTWLVLAFAGLLAATAARGSRLRPLLRVGIGFAIGAVLSLANMLPVLLATGDSARELMDVERMAQNRVGWTHLLSLVWPDLVHWASDAIQLGNDPERVGAFARPPWLQYPLLDRTGSRNYVEESIAIGIPGVLAAVLGLFDARRRFAWFFAAAGLLAFLTASAVQPLLSLWALVPGGGAADIRRLLFPFVVALVVLAGFGADRLSRRNVPAAAHTLLGIIAVVSLGGLLLMLSLDGESLLQGTARATKALQDHPEIQSRSAEELAAWLRATSYAGEDEVNLARLRWTFGRAALVALAAAALLFWRRGRRRVLALAALTGLELLEVGRGPMQTVPAERITTAPKLVQPVLAMTRPDEPRPRLQRLAAPLDELPFVYYGPNFAGWHGLADACAYTTLAPRRMREFFLALEPDRAGKVSVSIGSGGILYLRDPRSLVHPLARLFGIQYVITDQPGPPECREVGRSGPFRLLELPAALPRATFVHHVDIEPDPTARLQRLADPQRDVANRVLLEDTDAPVPAPPQAPAPASVRITGYRDQRVTVEVDTAADGYLRLADPFDPGWRATVDGETRPILVADHYLRAVHVPAGKHTVQFTFDQARVVWPPRLSLLALLTIAVLWFWPGKRA